MAWKSSDNPLGSLQSLGKVPSCILLSLIHSFHNAQPSVVKSCRRSSTHFRTSKIYTLHTGPHVVAPPCLTLTSKSSKTRKTEPMDTVDVKRKECWGYKGTPMGNVVAQHIPNCGTRLIKAGEPLQSSHTGWPRTRAFTATALCAIGTAAEVARLFKFLF